ncbi:uncharacterized protein LOC115677846 [Syzygium oleosum]|uniref:uncharacterized protein LOC115677846 n=1 Tax=Syzygium oleosum TaxID=219896 RepID=UPI0024BA4FBC|nr:uncharacterized protein LOC115677846 [Syzygium oleosum]
MEEDYGWGSGSILMIVVVAAVLLLAPLVMGSVQPPGLSLLFFPVVLVAVFLFLCLSSK